MEESRGGGSEGRGELRGGERRGGGEEEERSGG